ncbi:MAG: transposase family protein [Lawsonibacter sp.]
MFLKLPRTKHPCPACGALTDRVHDYRMQTVKDVPFGRKTLLHLRKRRYRCICGKRFFEKNFFLPRYHRVTSRLVAAIIGAFHELVPASEIGARYNVSGATAARYFKYVAFKPTQLPEVLSIDEFKGNSGGEKYNSIIVDAENTKWSRFYQIALRTILSNISHNSHPKPV